MTDSIFDRVAAELRRKWDEASEHGDLVWSIPGAGRCYAKNTDKGVVVTIINLAGELHVQRFGIVADYRECLL